MEQFRPRLVLVLGHNPFCLDCMRCDEHVMLNKQNVGWHLLCASARKIVALFELLGMPLVTELPIFLTCMAIYGFKTMRSIRAMMINPDPTLSMERLWESLALYGLIGYVFSAINHFGAKRWIKYLTYAIILVLFLVEEFLGHNFELHISPGVFMLMGETTSREASEFLVSTWLSPASVMAYAHVVILIIAILFMEHFRARFSKAIDTMWIKAPIMALTFVIICAGLWSFQLFNKKLFGCETTDQVSRYVSGFGSFPTDPYTEIVYSLYDLHLASGEIQLALNTALRNNDSSTILPGVDSLNVVLVIGESFIKHHASLYGYELKTTPFLDRMQNDGQLYAFDNVVSPYNLTSLALRNMLFCNSLGDNESWHETLFFPMVFKRAGYNVMLWDNQLKMNKDAAFSFALNSFLYNKEICRLSYTQTNDKSFEYDAEIILDYARKTRSGNCNFIIFHLMGQHVAYEERYPHQQPFEYFTADSIRNSASYMTSEKLQCVAEYDNATRYNDYVIKLIVDRFANQNAVIVYLSDHGEEVYDFRDSCGRQHGALTKNLVRYQFEIPFMIWCSDRFRENYPELCSLIASSVHRPLMTDNLCHLLFHLAGIETQAYISSRDVISPDYKCPKRLINDKVEYDEVMRR